MTLYIIDVAHDNSELGVYLSGTDELPKAVNNTDQRLEDLTEENNAARLKAVMLGEMTAKEAAREAKEEIEQHFRGAEIHLNIVVGHLERMLEDGFDFEGDEAQQILEVLGRSKQPGIGAIKYSKSLSPVTLRAKIRRGLAKS